jgi:hypothetical protein
MVFTVTAKEKKDGRRKTKQARKGKGLLNKELIDDIFILELILLRSRGNAKKVKIFHPAVDYVF